jgi:peptidylprolyl isomerase
MQSAKTGDKVTVHYTGKLTDGTQFDTSRPDSPIEFTIGESMVISGFEQAVIGMSPGDTKTTTIPQAEGYGPHREEMILTVDRANIPANIDLELGQQLGLQYENNQSLTVTVTNISEDAVTLDGNHPLAGQDLVFDIHLVEIA